MCQIEIINITFDGRPIESKKSDPKKGASNVECSTSEEGCFGCRIFDIRRTTNRMSKIRHPKNGASDVEYPTFDYEADRVEKIRSEEGCFEYSTFDGRLIECRIFDIRRKPISDRKSDRIFLHTSTLNSMTTTKALTKSQMCLMIPM